jgi:tetratricopeptide (TPR) repeat protein
MHGQKGRNGLLFIIVFLAVSSVSWGASDITQQGAAFLKAQRFDEAVKVLSKAIKDNPQDAQAIHFRGMARYYQGNIDQAVADYSRAIEINPQLSQAYTSRGVALFRKGDYQRAKEDLKQAYSQNPKDTNALNQMAWMLAVCPDKEYRNGKKALDLARKVINLKTTPNFLDTLAAAYAETGRYKDAARIQRKVIALLSQEERLNNIEVYLERLKKYEAHEPWRQDRSMNGDTGLSKTENNELTGTKDKKNEKKIAVTPPIPPQKTDKPTSTVTEAAKQPKPVISAFPYTIFISTYQDPEISAQKVLNLKKRGDPAFVSHAYFKDSGHWYQIYYGWFKNASDATRAVQKLKKRKFRKAIVVKKPYAVQAAASPSEATLKKIENRLVALNYPTYRLPDTRTPGLVRLLIGAYSSKTVPDKLMAVLRKSGFKPQVVRR